MGEKPYYQAEQDALHGTYSELEDAINQHGERKEGLFLERYDREADEHGHKEIEIDSWAHGPLLRIEDFDSSGETRPPTLGNGIVTVVFQAGYVPWGFRPENRPSDSGGREHTGRWLWYLRDRSAVTNKKDSPLYETEYVIRHDDGTYLRNEEGYTVSFDNEQDAEAVADQVQDDEVVEVPQ